MKYIADLHVHSKYSRATAKNLDLENLYIAGQLKGITVLGTGDVTHPAWFTEIKEKLVPAEEGLFKLKKDITRPVRDTYRKAVGIPSDLSWFQKSAIFIRNWGKPVKITILFFFRTLNPLKNLIWRSIKSGISNQMADRYWVWMPEIFWRYPSKYRRTVFWCRPIYGHPGFPCWVRNQALIRFRNVLRI